MSNLHSESFRSIRSQRLSALACLEAALAGIADNEKTTTRQLVQAAPPPLRSILENEGVVRNLFTYGFTSFKLVYSEAPKGCRSKRSVSKLFRQLEKDWGGAASISVCTQEPHRATIRFSVP